MSQDCNNSNSMTEGIEVRKKRDAIRNFQNPPQPHMCVQTFRQGCPLPCYVNVLWWQEVTMITSNRAFSFYGGMAIPPPRSEDPQVSVFAVLVHPKVLRLFGKNALEHMRHTFIEQLLRFVEEANNVTLSRMYEVLKDQDIVGELKEVWMAVQCQRDMEMNAICQLECNFGGPCDNEPNKMYIEGQQQHLEPQQQQFMHNHHHHYQQQPPQYPPSYPPQPPPPMSNQDQWFEYTAKTNAERIKPEFWNTVQHIEDIIPNYPVQNIPIQMLPMFMSEVTSTMLQPSVYYHTPSRQQHQNDHFHRQPPFNDNNEDTTLQSDQGRQPKRKSYRRLRVGKYVLDSHETQAKREAAVNNANDYSRIISNVVRMTETTKSQRMAINKNGWYSQIPYVEKRDNNYSPDEELVAKTKGCEETESTKSQRVVINKNSNYRYNGPRDNYLPNEASKTLDFEANERRSNEEASCSSSSSSNSSRKVVEKQQRYKILRKEDVVVAGASSSSSSNSSSSNNQLINNFTQLSLNDCNKESSKGFHTLIVDYQKSCVTDNE